MASRRASLSLRLAILAAACGLGVTAAASGAAAALAQPAPASGTVKIDGVPVDNSPANEPHVGCDFAVQFFGFPDESATIRFNIQPPSGSFNQLLSENVTHIGDGMGGGNILDKEVFFTFADLGLPDNFFEQPQQGFHVKLSVELPGGTEKHKVFWIKCAQSPSPSVSPTKTVKPTASPSVLPVTGTTGLGGLTVLGVALIAGGAGLMGLLVTRRRRDKLSSTD